ncbi:MAG: FAD-dependent oxidoreductase, partial [Planctomycetia bacterium]|nr:FAD-dependent oxidoreductase [Planctomycetia bacterium]
YTGLEPERTRILLYDMVTEAGADVLLHTWAADAWTDGDRHIIIIETKAGREAIVARQVIDCTGDGDVAARLGAPFENFIGEKAWGTSLTFRMANVYLEKLLPWMEENGKVTQILRGVKIGGTEPEIMRLSMAWGGEMLEEAKSLKLSGGMILNSLCRHEATYCNCVWRKYEDNLDPVDLTTSEVFLRKMGQTHAALMRKYVPGCEDAYVCSHSPTLGVRLSRIFDTEYEIPRDDVLSGRHYDDTIGFLTFIDLGDYVVTNAGCFGIPYRSFVPLKVENLLLSGRMISRDNVVFQTTRNTVSCVIQGQASGTAAALSIEHGTTPRKLDPQLLREVLAADGAKVDCPELKQD